MATNQELFYRYDNINLAPDSEEFYLIINEVIKKILENKRIN